MTDEQMSDRVDLVADRIMSYSLTVGVTKKASGGYTYTSDTIQEALLYDIARSLRQLLGLLRCSNVAQAVRDVNIMGRIARRKLRRKKPCRSR